MQMGCNLREFKEYIDNEMIVILGQMDSPTEIFEHVYLVILSFSITFRFHVFPFPVSATPCLISHSVIYHHLTVYLGLFKGFRMERV